MRKWTVLHCGPAKRIDLWPSKVPPSLKFTVPVGAGPEAATTVAVKITACPAADEFKLEASVMAAVYAWPPGVDQRNCWLRGRHHPDRPPVRLSGLPAGNMDVVTVATPFLVNGALPSGLITFLKLTLPNGHHAPKPELRQRKEAVKNGVEKGPPEFRGL
jgi:hypothetical protein